MSACGQDLVLIKGAPGVGKSASAKLLASRFPMSALVEVDMLRGMVTNVNWRSQAEHRSVLDLSARLAADFLRAGFSPVILVDTFSGDKVHGFLAAFLSACPQGRVFVAVLHASEDILRQRVLNREVGGFRDMTICRRINQEVVCDASPFETLIDTSTHSPADVAGEIARALGSSSSPVSRAE